MKTQLFELHPELEVYYETSDGMQFFRKNDADRHARELEDKTIAIFQRDASSEVIPENPIEKIEQTEPVVRKNKVKTKQ